MDNRELDALVAEKIFKWDISIWNYSTEYSTDIAAAMQVEDRIEELGLIEEYCMHLNEIANAHWDGGKRQPQRWQLIHATPEDRCRAALKAVERKHE